jgi:hypothetical protein
MTGRWEKVVEEKALYARKDCTRPAPYRNSDRKSLNTGFLNRSDSLRNSRSLGFHIAARYYGNCRLRNVRKHPVDVLWMITDLTSLAAPTFARLCPTCGVFMPSQSG